MTYPTSQQLQELRDSFAAANGVEVFGPEEGGAWDMERQCGIGYRIQPLPGPCWHPDPHSYRGTDARRGANELRSRAWSDYITSQPWPDLDDAQMADAVQAILEQP